METDSLKKNSLLILWFFCAGLYSFLVLPKIAKPIAGWEICTWEVARSIAVSHAASVKFFYLPPLYASLIAFSFIVFGISEISARSVGIACFIAMPVVIYALIREVLGGRKESLRAALIALGIFIFSPAAVQGSLVIDHPDTNLFMLLACLFYIFLFKTEKAPFGRRVFCLGVLYALCIWAKMTTSLAFLIALPVGAALSGEKTKGLRLCLSALILGAALFTFSWFSYCYFMAGIGRFIEPLAYYIMNTSDSILVAPGEKMLRIILDMFRVSVWFSPFLLILGGAGIFEALRNLKARENKKIVHLASFILVVMTGYFATNATFSSFPKYLVPALPMLCCVIGCYSARLFKGLPRPRVFVILVLSLAAGTAYYFLFVGDLIYEIFLLRQAQLFGTVRAYMCARLIKWGLYFVFPLAVGLLSIKFISLTLSKRIILGLLIALICANAAVSFLQRKADYSLNYAYGAKGIEELKEFLKEKAPLEVFTTTEGIIANLRGIQFSGVNAQAWNSPSVFAGFMDKKKPRAFLYGLATNNTAQLKTILFNPGIRAFFSKYYKEYVFGSYILLIREENRFESQYP